MRAPLRYKCAFDKNGRSLPWLLKLGQGSAKSGVYVIRDARTHVTLYVGESHSGRLAKTLKRHFATWNDATQRIHQVYPKRGVEVAVRVTRAGQAIEAQNDLIERLLPRDNILGTPADDDGEAPF